MSSQNATRLGSPVSRSDLESLGLSKLIKDRLKCAQFCPYPKQAYVIHVESQIAISVLAIARLIPSGQPAQNERGVQNFGRLETSFADNQRFDLRFVDELAAVRPRQLNRRRREAAVRNDCALIATIMPHAGDRLLH